MDDARALLNSLMGADRNSTKPGEQRSKRKFTDSDICRHYLMGLCPHDLFKNTKMDLGQCDKDHNEHLKDEFEADPEVEKYRRKWRRNLQSQLKRQLLDVDRRIGMNQTRIAREKDGTIGIQATDEHKQQLASLKEEVSARLRQAEKAADDGKFEESRSIIKDTEATKRSIEDLESKRFEKYKKDNICDICGLIVDGEEIEAMKTGRGWHINGKQHLGYKAIREKLKDIEDAQAKDKRDGVRSPTPSPVKERKDPVQDTKRRKVSRSPARTTRTESKRGKRSLSRSLDRRRKADDRKRKYSRSKSRRGKRKSPSRSRRRESRRKASRSRKRGSRSNDKKRSKKNSSPKRKSSSSEVEKPEKTKKSSKPLVETPSAPAAPPPPPEPAKSPPPPSEPPRPPPEPAKEEPKAPEPDIDAVRPRMAFFLGVKPVK